MKTIIAATLSGAALTLAALAGAHHSAAVLFDLDKQITIEGSVSRFTLGNPHARIYLLVADENGDVAEWMAEGGSRTVLLRNGWTGDEVSPGDVIQIIGNPSRDGSNIIHWENLILPDGTKLWGEDIPDDAILEDLRDRRR